MENTGTRMSSPSKPSSVMVPRKMLAPSSFGEGSWTGEDARRYIDKTRARRPPHTSMDGRGRPSLHRQKRGQERPRHTFQEATNRKGEGRMPSPQPAGRRRYKAVSRL